MALTCERFVSQTKMSGSSLVKMTDIADSPPVSLTASPGNPTPDSRKVRFALIARENFFVVEFESCLCSHFDVGYISGCFGIFKL